MNASMRAKLLAHNWSSGSLASCLSVTMASRFEIVDEKHITKIKVGEKKCKHEE